MGRKVLALLVISSLLFTTGCWSSKELSESAFLSGIAIEKEEDQYRLSVQVLQPVKVKKNSGSAYTIVSVKGDTIIEGIRRIVKGLKRRLFLTQTRAVIIDTELVKEENIYDMLDLFYRDQQFRYDSYLYVAENPAEILGQESPLDPMTAFGLFSAMEAIVSDVGEMPAVTTEDFAEIGMKPHYNPYVTILKVHNEKPPAETHIDINGTAIFKKGKIVKMIKDYDQTRGILLFDNRIKGGQVSFKVDDIGKVAVEIVNNDTKIIPSKKDGKMTVDVQVNTRADINEYESKKKLTKQVFNKIEQTFEKKLKQDMRSTLKTMREEPVTDPLRIGLEIHRHYPKYWRKHEDKWDDVFKDIPINITVKSNLTNIGLIKNMNKRVKPEQKKKPEKNLFPFGE